MHEIALDLLIFLGGVWLVAVTLGPLGLPTIMGELIVGQWGDGMLTSPASFSLARDDDIYLCGTVESFNRFYDSYQQDAPPLAPVPT